LFNKTKSQTRSRARKRTIALNHGTLRSVAGPSILGLFALFHAARAREREKEREREKDPGEPFTPRHRIPQESDSRRGIYFASYPPRRGGLKQRASSISARRYPSILPTDCEIDRSIDRADARRRSSSARFRRSRFHIRDSRGEFRDFEYRRAYSLRHSELRE